MRRASASRPVESLSRLALEGTRLFVVFTLAEALALTARQAVDVEARMRGLAKIRTAIEHVKPKDVTSVDNDVTPAIAVPSLRAKTYQPRPPLRVAKADLRPSRIQKVSIDPPVATPAIDNYVPWRDEAGGIYE